MFEKLDTEMLGRLEVKISKKASKKEAIIKEAISESFSLLNFDCIPHIKIKVKVGDVDDCLATMEDADERGIWTIRLDYSVIGEGRKSLSKTIAHECYHIFQTMVLGFRYISESDRWHYNGDTYQAMDVTDSRYEDQPHERDAILFEQLVWDRINSKRESIF